MRYTSAVSLLLPIFFAACGPEKSQTTPPARGGAAPSEQDPRPAPTLLEVLAKNRQEGELLVALPGDVIDARVEKELTDGGQPLRKMRKPNYVRYQFYTNNLIQDIRAEASGTMWIVYDESDPGLVEYLRDYFLARHEVRAEYAWDGVRLVHVANEVAGGASTGVDLERVDVDIPGFVTGLELDASGEWMFVTLKGGEFTCYSMKDPGLKRQVLQLPSLRNAKAGVFTGGESGLVGLVLHPQFASNGRVFLHYNWQDEAKVKTAKVVEYTLARARGGFEVASQRLIFESPQPHTDHNGGDMVFGPDGFLYFGVGDGLDGEWTIGRSPAKGNRGKIFRIDVDDRDGDLPYAVPQDNPFVGHDTIRPEVWAWGFRNPWRLSMLPDGRLLAGDIGEDKNEEITFVKRGRHHGWPYVEGAFRRNPWSLEGDPVKPLVAYERLYGNSVVAGRVFRGDIDWLKGKYLFGDHLTGRIWAIDLPAADAPETEPLGGDEILEVGRWPELITTFAEGPDGTLYVGCARGVFRLVSATDAKPAEQAAAVEPLPDETARSMFEAEVASPGDREVGPDELAAGRLLYSSPALSKGGDVSCATCHPLDAYGHDGNSWPIAIKGKQQQRNTLSTFNAHRQFGQFADYRAETVEAAVLDMLRTGNGLEQPAQLEAALAAQVDLVAALKKAYDGDASVTSAVKAIGAFVRSLRTTSRWDEYLDGRDDALTVEEKKGLSLFVTTGCISCHQYRTLGGGMPQRLGLMIAWEGEDRGRADFSGVDTEAYYYKVPSLLNVTKTGPYYHDGSQATLRDAVVHMASAQLNRELSDDQVRLMMAFFESLTGEAPASAR